MPFLLHMAVAAASSSSHFTKAISRHKLLTLSLLLLLLSLSCFFLFNRGALEPKLGDLSLISQTPAPLLVSRSPHVHDEFDASRQPASIPLILEGNADGNSTVASEFPEPEEQITAPVASISDLDGEIADKNSSLSSPAKMGGDSGEKTGDPDSSDEENEMPISSNSDFDGNETPRNASAPLDSESEGDSGEKNGEPESSEDEKRVPITSNSDFDGGNSEEDAGVKVEAASSSVTETRGFVDNAVAEQLRGCDIYSGTWVKDEGHPLYTPGSCPYVDEAFDCQSNGRPDSAYTQWRWKPDECELPRFNATDFLVRLRGKSLMLVGDSMNRNQFESLLCLLREGLQDKSRMYETRGNKITKGRGYFIFKFEDYDCTVAFVRSHFLVREGVRVNGQGNSNPTLSIDRIDKSAARWLRADILVFNTGHWWTHGKTSRGKNYYKEGDYVYPKFDAVEAYRRAINTWATWIKKNIKPDQLVFYRGYSSAHFRGGDWDSGGSCNGETKPVLQGSIIDSYPQKMTIVDEIIKETQVNVVLLNVTRLTNFRKDGHPSVYGKNVTLLKKVSTRKQDCSHWCLPGVPDAWNELIYATLVARQS